MEEGRKRKEAEEMPIMLDGASMLLVFSLIRVHLRPSAVDIS
jgi:hypothetical protein